MDQNRKQMVEDRLKANTPAQMESPEWLRTRVLARLEDEPQGSEAVFSNTLHRFFAGAAGVAALACVAVALVMFVPQAPAPIDDDGWASTQSASFGFSLIGGVSLERSAVLENEAKNLQSGVTQLAGAVRASFDRIVEGVRIR